MRQAREQFKALRLIAAGNNQKQTAKLMGITHKSLEYVLLKARRTLNANDTPHALAIAMRRGLICAFCLAFNSFAAQFLAPTNPPPVVQASWNAITDPSVTNVNVYWGVQSRGYTNEFAVGMATNATITLPGRGVTFYFALTAQSSGGLESDFSTEVAYTPATPPTPPTLRPMIILHAQSSPAATGPFLDAGMDWSLTPSQAKQFFKLRLENPPLASVIVKPQIHLPPPPR